MRNTSIWLEKSGMPPRTEAFQTRPTSAPPSSAAAANRSRLTLYRAGSTWIVPKLTDDIQKAITGMLDPVYKEGCWARPKCARRSRSRTQASSPGAWCDGLLQRGASARVKRGGAVVHDSSVSVLGKYLKDDVKEAKERL